PPAADLARWGAHDIYVANRRYRSSTVRQFVARFVTARFSLADPVRQRLYVLSARDFLDPAALLIFDLRRGDLLQTVDGIASSVMAFTISTDGHYLYILSGSP